MNIFRRLALSWRASRDARYGIHQGNDVILSRLGPQPRFDPVGNSEHTQLLRDINNQAEIEERMVDLHRKQDERAKHDSLTGQNFLIAALFIAEVLAAIYVLKEMGVPNPERSVFGGGLAAGLFWVCSQLASSQQAAQASGRRTVWFWLVMLIYVAVVLAIGTFRAESAGADTETTRTMDWSTAVIMLATTVGPAWMFESLWRRRAPVARLAREIRNDRARIWKLQRDQKAAERKQVVIARASADWARKHDEYLAHYNVRHNYKTARLTSDKL